MNKRAFVYWMLIVMVTFGNSSLAMDFGWGQLGNAILEALFRTCEQAEEDGDESSDDRDDSDLEVQEVIVEEVVLDSPLEDEDVRRDKTQESNESHATGDVRNTKIDDANPDSNVVKDSKQKDAVDEIAAEFIVLEPEPTPMSMSNSLMMTCFNNAHANYKEAKKRREKNRTRPLISYIMASYKQDWRSLVSFAAKDKDGFKPDDVMFVCRKHEEPHSASIVDAELFDFFMTELKKAQRQELFTSIDVFLGCGNYNWAAANEFSSVLLALIERNFVASFTHIIKTFPKVLAELSTTPAYEQRQDPTIKVCSVVDWLMRPYQHLGLVGKTNVSLGYLDRKQDPKKRYIKAAVAIVNLMLVDYPQSKLDGKLLSMIALLARQGDLPATISLEMALHQWQNLDGLDVASIPEDQRQEISGILTGALKQQFDKLIKKSQEQS